MIREITINFKDKNMKKGNFMFKVLLMLIAGIFLSIDAFAQQITVKGIVKDTTGEPVIGANVVVKGTTTGTITDFDGNFQLSAKQGDIIVVSFIGYQPQELPVAAQMNVILKDDTEILDEVVVIGYGQVKKNDMTGSVMAIKPDELSKGITPDMLVTAPVGTFTVNVRNGSLSASKTVTISKDATTTVDFSEVQTDPVKTGAVNFSVTPSGAVMSIDGTEVDYSSPVSLTYGTHRIKLVANNYQEYSEIINVNSAYVTKVIDMTSSGTSTSTAADNTSGYKVSITAPKGAVLYVNSEYIGTVPCSFDKSSGKKTITLSQNGYNTVSYTISIANTAGDLTYAFPEMISGGTQETTTQVQVPTVTPATTKSSTKQSTKRR